MASDYLWPAATSQPFSTTLSVGAAAVVDPSSFHHSGQAQQYHHLPSHRPALSAAYSAPASTTSSTPNANDTVSLPTYFVFDGFNLTLPEHQERLRQAVRHLRTAADAVADGSSGAPQCPSLDMPVGNAISMLLYAIVFFVGLVGNTLVIYVVLRFSKMHTVTNTYILNLAVADECFLIGIPFLIYTMQTGGWTLGKWACKAYMISTSVTQFTSSMFLFIMSADRYVAVCHPIAATRYRSPFVAKVVSAGAWLASAVMMVPVFWFANTIERVPDGGGGGGGGADDGQQRMTCNIEWTTDYESSGSTFTLYSFVVGFAMPLTLILGFYYMVLRKLRTVGPKARSQEKRRTHKKVTKLVLTVITVYVLCWLPYWISQVALISSSPDVCHSRLQVTMFVLVGCLGYSNSAMNPVLYAFLSDNFKKSFLKACTCAARKELNVQQQMENSVPLRFGRRAAAGGGGGGGGGSERGGGHAGGGAAGDGGGGGGGRTALLVDVCVTDRIEGGGKVGGAGRGTNETVDERRFSQYAETRVGMDGMADVISESMQTKSTAVSMYKNSDGSSGGANGGCERTSGGRPPVLHTDL